MTKICTMCKVEKPATRDYFYKGYSKSGLSPRCQSCTQEAKRISREKHPTSPEKRRHYVRTYRERHPERVKRNDRRQNLRRKFGIEEEDYLALLESQHGKCAICSQEPETKLLAVDHDHSCCPGQKSCGDCIRGLLCSNCNTALGLLDDSIERLRRAQAYLSEALLA